MRLILFFLHIFYFFLLTQVIFPIRIYCNYKRINTFPIITISSINRIGMLSSQINSLELSPRSYNYNLNFIKEAKYGG